MSKLAVPLVLPNNCTWDPRTGTYNKKEGVERATLNTIPKALDQLRDIKGPVSVVSIAGPCRGGKSYLLSKAFDQGEVFPLGHLVDPETMGIWLWVVPKKFKNKTTGQEFTVVLLDSEGIDSVYAKQTDDHRIFTLAVLLSSILMYNSSAVPKKGDLEGLGFITKLSQRIQLRSTQKHPKDKDESHFHQAFPYFIWLLRDVVLKLPEGYSSFKDYFVGKVFSAKSQDSSTGDKKTAESILNFFSGFDAFSLPPPAYDEEVVQNLNNKESEANPKFFKQIGLFKENLHSKLSPKKSINEGEFVTGEALAAMVLLYVEALNTPGAVPNVQSAWDIFVGNKCVEVSATALDAYKKELTSQVTNKIPCEADEIRKVHEKALQGSLAFFRQETLNLSAATVGKYLDDLVGKMNNFLSSLLAKNEQETDKHCTNLIKRLKRSILDKVFIRLRGPDGSSMDFKEIVGARDEMEKAYFEKARGDHNIRAVVFVRFNEDFKEEVNRNLDLLQKMKDYDADLVKQKAEYAALEQQRKKDEEQNKRLEEERKTREKEIKMLQEKYEKDREVLEKNLKDNMEAQARQMENLQRAFLDEMAKEREAVNAQRLEDTQEKLREVQQREAVNAQRLADAQEKLREVQQREALNAQRLEDTQEELREEKERGDLNAQLVEDTQEELREEMERGDLNAQLVEDTQEELRETKEQLAAATNLSRLDHFIKVFTG